MDHLSDAALHQLQLVAGEIINTLEADGHHVGDAVQQHPSFQEGQGPTSALERALVKTAAKVGARKAGMTPCSTSGGGLDLVAFEGWRERHFTVKTATYAGGAPDLLVGANSHLVTNPQEPGAMFTVVRWVLCFRTDDDSSIAEIFAAEVVGHSGDGPVHLRLGKQYPLAPITEPDDFAPSDDDDLGDYDDGTPESGVGNI